MSFFIILLFIVLGCMIFITFFYLKDFLIYFNKLLLRFLLFVIPFIYFIVFPIGFSFLVYSGASGDVNFFLFTDLVISSLYSFSLILKVSFFLIVRFFNYVQYDLDFFYNLHGISYFEMIFYFFWFHFIAFFNVVIILFIPHSYLVSLLQFLMEEFDKFNRRLNHKKGWIDYPPGLPSFLTNYIFDHNLSNDYAFFELILFSTVWIGLGFFVIPSFAVSMIIKGHSSIVFNRSFSFELLESKSYLVSSLIRINIFNCFYDKFCVDSVFFSVGFAENLCDVTCTFFFC